MGALATRHEALAWVCADCGHGSVEPRDRSAHVDAHRQLRRFLEDWDLAAAADRAAERRRRLRPFAYAALALLVVVLVVTMAVRVVGRRDLPLLLAGPVPALDLPRHAAAPVADAPVSPPAGAATTPPRPRKSTAAPSGPSTRPSAASHVLTGDGAPPRQTPVSAATSAPVTSVASAPSTPAPPAVTVSGCLVVVCIALGP